MYSKLFVYKVFVIEMLFCMYVCITCYERILSNVFLKSLKLVQKFLKNL